MSSSHHTKKDTTQVIEQGLMEEISYPPNHLGTPASCKTNKNHADFLQKPEKLRQ